MHSGELLYELFIINILLFIIYQDYQKECVIICYLVIIVIKVLYLFIIYNCHFVLYITLFKYRNK